MLASAGDAALPTAAAAALDLPPAVLAAPACALSGTLHTARPPDSAEQRRQPGWPRRQAAPAARLAATQANGGLDGGQLRQLGRCAAAAAFLCDSRRQAQRSCLQSWLAGAWMPGWACQSAHHPTWLYSFDSADCSRAADSSVNPPAWMAPFMARSALVAALCGAAFGCGQVGRQAGVRPRVWGGAVSGWHAWPAAVSWLCRLVWKQGKQPVRRGGGQPEAGAGSQLQLRTRRRERTSALLARPPLGLCPSCCCSASLMAHASSRLGSSSAGGVRMWQ